MIFNSKNFVTSDKSREVLDFFNQFKDSPDYLFSPESNPYHSSLDCVMLLWCYINVMDEQVNLENLSFPEGKRVSNFIKAWSKLAGKEESFDSLLVKYVLATMQIPLHYRKGGYRFYPVKRVIEDKNLNYYILYVESENGILLFHLHKDTNGFKHVLSQCNTVMSEGFWNDQVIIKNLIFNNFDSELYTLYIRHKNKQQMIEYDNDIEKMYDIADDSAKRFILKHCLYTRGIYELSDDSSIELVMRLYHSYSIMRDHIISVQYKLDIADTKIDFEIGDQSDRMQFLPAAFAA